MPNGVHFIGLVNVVDLKPGGHGQPRQRAAAWLKADLSRPLRIDADRGVRPHPALGGLAGWGWGTDDGARALGYLKRFGSVTVLNGHIHQIIQKVEGKVAFHTARSTAFPQPAPGGAPDPAR